MAPERIDGREYSLPSDIWSLGLTILTLALGRLPLNTEGGFWSILHCVRDLAPPTLPLGGHWSNEFRDFLSKCLIQDPVKRATCAELLQHPFILKSQVENDIVSTEENSILELKSIVLAVYQHILKLDSSGPSILLNICRDYSKDIDVQDSLCRILFGENINDDTNGLIATARLSILSTQLHLTIEQTIKTMREIFIEVKKDMKESVSSFLSTPKAQHSTIIPRLNISPS